MSPFEEQLRSFAKALVPERKPKDGSEYNKGWNDCLAKIQSARQLLLGATQQVLGGKDGN